MGCLSKKTVKAINSIIEEASVVVLRFSKLVEKNEKKSLYKGKSAHILGPLASKAHSLAQSPMSKADITS
jgi:hypothetical protein